MYILIAEEDVESKYSAEDGWELVGVEGQVDDNIDKKHYTRQFINFAYLII